MCCNECVTTGTKTAKMNHSAEAVAGAVDFSATELSFPVGILGFPTCHHYRLERFRSGTDEHSPFFMLNSLEQDLAFPLIAPQSIGIDYRFAVSAELLNALKASSAADLCCLVIVTTRERLEDITVNLQGPLIINPQSSLGFQIVNESYPLRHPLLK